ncbi:MAG: prepilin-type N-terminal cleavage/methylation domain-containing protein, partial [Erysipelotrichia bacterium]|nr:prepilin-type N-terminal cleavage/methylation domain-containing protein [Erysipelotrichia bacterium]
MKLLRDKKGMTLVEVVVVLLIMSILLVIMGSLILNAFKYFNQTTDQDLDKRSLDSISEYVREELLYAQDVRVYSTSEVKKATQEEGFAATQWQTLFIKEGKLYKNGEMVYTDSFYNQKKLYIDVQGIKNYRLDIHYSLKEEDKKTYETNDTLELLNLKVKIEKTKDFYPFKNIVDRTEISEDVQIYYQKVKEEENIEPDVPVDPEKGTVADQIKCLTLHNNRWKFVDNHYYRAGDMVYHNGYWWQLYNTDNYISGPQIPGIQNTVWKKIDAYFDENSIYLKGDIVIFNNKYY